MQGIYTYIPETNYVPREYSVAAILLLLCMVLISLVSVLNLLYFYMCAVPNMAALLLLLLCISEHSPLGITYCKTTPFRPAIRLLSTKRPLLTQLSVDRLVVAGTHAISTSVPIVCIKKCKFPLWFSDNLKHYIKRRTISVGVLRNVGLITITTNFHQTVGLLKQPDSVKNSAGLKVPIITSRQI